jgi:26S proteasome regulatory subunit N3
MGGDKPHINGSDKAENGANGSEDVEMEEDSIDPGKSAKGKGKEADEEMTVVVPPSKSSKLSGSSQKDGQGDVAMNGEGNTDVETAKEPEIDPRTTASSSKCTLKLS